MKKKFFAVLPAFVLACLCFALVFSGMAFAQGRPVGSGMGPPSDLAQDKPGPGIGPPDFVKEKVVNASNNADEKHTQEDKNASAKSDTTDKGDATGMHAEGVQKEKENKSWFQRNIVESGMMVQFRKGGFIMYFILACSICGVYIFLERLYSLRIKRMLPPAFLAQILNELPEGNVDIMQERKIIRNLMNICGERDIPLARSLRTGLMVHTEGIAGIKAAITSNNDREALLMSKGVPILGLLSNVAPLLGLLGTVTGMIKAFDMLAAAGAGKPELVAAGIGEALVTTAGGLFVGIPLLLLTNIVQGKIDNSLMDMEEFALEVIERLIYREAE